MARFVAEPGMPAWGDAPAYRDYLAGVERVRRLFSHDPDAPGSAERRLEALSAFPAARRRRVAALLAEAQRRLGAGPEAEAAARSLADPEAVAVTTGQQPGLLTGPLFTVYKAASAVTAAREASRRLGRPVVPVFWVVGDDHDWDEASRLAVVSGTGELRRFRLDSPLAGRPLGDIPVPGDALTLAEDVVTLAGAGGAAFAGEVRAFLLESARASADVSEWFCRILARLFRGQGLVVLDPTDPGWSEESADFYREVAERAPEVEAALAAGAEDLAGAGYPVALPPGEHALLFYRGEGSAGRRLGLLRRDGGFASRRGEVRFGAAELAVLAGRQPGALSPGAALRPLLRDRLLPVLAHVAGPGEVAYLAQLRPLYRAFGMGMPIVHPRLSLTLVSPEASARLSSLGLGPGDVAAGGRALDAVLERSGGQAVTAALARARREVAEGHGRLVEALAAAGVDVGDLARGNLERMLAQLDYLEAKARQRLRARHREAAEAFARLRDELFPGGQPQEKVLNVVPWLCRAGWGFAGELLRAPWTGRHQVAVWEG